MCLDDQAPVFPGSAEPATLSTARLAWTLNCLGKPVENKKPDRGTGFLFALTFFLGGAMNNVWSFQKAEVLKNWEHAKLGVSF